MFEHEYEEKIEQNVSAITITADGNETNTFHLQTHSITALQNCPLIMSPTEVAQILRIGRNSIYALLRAGQLKSIRIGKLIKIPRSALEEYLQKR